MVFGHHRGRTHRSGYPTWVPFASAYGYGGAPRTTIITSPTQPAPSAGTLQVGTFVAVGAVIAALAVGGALVYMAKK